MTSLDLDTKRQRIETIAKIAGVGLLGFLVAPFVFVAVKGLLGMIVAGIISFTAIQFMPYFAAVIANWRLKALKAEASANPIETLQQDFMQRAEGLRKYRDSLRSFKGEIGTFESKFNEFAEKYPQNVAGIAKFSDQLKKMQALFEMRGRKYKQAMDNLATYQDQIDRANGEWEMAKAAAQMNKFAGVDADQFLRNIQVDTAFDSVQKGLNSAFADLEISFLDEAQQPKQVEGVTTTIIDNTTPVEIKALPSSHPLRSLDLDFETEPAPVVVEAAPKRRASR